MKFLSPALSTIARLRYGVMEEWMNHPLEAQRSLLQHLVTRAQYTEIGRKYNFSNLFSIRKFKTEVPIHEYDDLKPYIIRMMSGEENILWDGKVNWFAKSSGTTSDVSKFIPITEESLHDTHYQGAKDVLSLYYYTHPDSDLLTGKGLVIGGSHQINQINDETSFGDLSAVLLQNTPFWGQWLRTPELSIALMDEWETKIEALAQSTINENVTSISGVPTWTLVLIKRILEISGKDTLKEVWPNLELYMHGGVSYVPYRQQFAQLIGKPIHYVEIYNASEGFFAASADSTNEDMLLFLDHGIFYEFLPVEDYGNPQATTVGLNKVELHRNYAPVITTNGGLWRYLVGDTIQFTSLHPYRIKVTGRLKHFINTFGEELIVDNADKAIVIASSKNNAVVNEYTAAPVYFSATSNGAHEWLIEFEKPPENLSNFVQDLDMALQSVNSDYQAKRHKDIAMRTPIVQSLKPGTFNGWLKQKNKLGGQHKVPRLCNDRKYVDDILSFIGKQPELSKNCL